VAEVCPCPVTPSNTTDVDRVITVLNQVLARTRAHHADELTDLFEG
jgi:hypothetical protein